MTLKFHPAPDRVAKKPEARVAGHAQPYIGRKFDAESREFRALADPAEVPDDGSKRTQRFKRLCAKGALLPADEATAQACGVEFVRVEQGADGEFRPVGRDRSKDPIPASKAMPRKPKESDK